MYNSPNQDSKSLLHQKVMQLSGLFLSMIFTGAGIWIVSSELSFFSSMANYWLIAGAILIL